MPPVLHEGQPGPKVSTSDWQRSCGIRHAHRVTVARMPGTDHSTAWHCVSARCMPGTRADRLCCMDSSHQSPPEQLYRYPDAAQRRQVAACAGMSEPSRAVVELTVLQLGCWLHLLTHLQSCAYGAA